MVRTSKWPLVLFCLVTRFSVFVPYQKKLMVISTSKQRRTRSDTFAPDWFRRARIEGTVGHAIGRQRSVNT